MLPKDACGRETKGNEGPKTYGFYFIAKCSGRHSLDRHEQRDPPFS